MMVDTRYYLHGILLPDWTLLSQLTDLTPSPNSEEVTGYSAGHPHPLFRGVRSQTPDATFSCSAVGQILAAILAGGNNYALDLSAGNTDLEYVQGQNLGSRYGIAASQHERLRMPKACLFWQSIAASEANDASITSRLLGLYDESNAPVVQVGTGVLVGTPAATQFYTLGPVKLNGSWLGNEQEWTLNSGVTAEEGRSGGNPWPTYGAVKQTDPTLSVRIHGKPWGNQGLGGTAITSLVAYLRAKTADGYNVADATPSHIKISATNGLVLPDTGTGGNNDPASSTLNAMLRAPSGSADVLTITVGSAIT